MFTQARPAAEQRSHWYVNVGAGKPSHEPEFAVNVAPVCVVPEIVGSVRLDGAPATPTAAEVEAAAPELFVAVTTTRRVWPGSVIVIMCVEPTSPTRSTQFAPSESHARH